MTLYGAAVGGIFSLVFAYAYGRIGQIGPRTLAAGLAILAFVVINFVPALKYPPNPPAVGVAETIQLRTGAYFAMLAVSLIATFAAFRIRAALAHQWSRFDATIGAVFGYAVVIAVVQALLPHFDEVPAGFPAQVLWNFRVASLGIQGALWLVIGLSFGWMADRRIRKAAGLR
jgi:predicted cobalt transporter CbtA